MKRPSWAASAARSSSGSSSESTSKARSMLSSPSSSRPRSHMDLGVAGRDPRRRMRGAGRLEELDCAARSARLRLLCAGARRGLIPARSCSSAWRSVVRELDRTLVRALGLRVRRQRRCALGRPDQHLARRRPDLVCVLGRPARPRTRRGSGPRRPRRSRPPPRPRRDARKSRRREVLRLALALARASRRRRA